MEPRARSILYAGALAASSLAYVMLDDGEGDVEGEPAASERAALVSLPTLTSSGGKDDATLKRDLFKVVEPPPPPPPPVAEAAPEVPRAPPPPPPPDRLSDLKVIGVVANGATLAILVEMDEETFLVAAGQKFGKDDALSIEGIEDNRVQVTDQLANVSKTFTLSEED